MHISIITLFPEVFKPILDSSILSRAQKKGKVSFELINLRRFGEGKHKVVDDRPYGGGAGMILRADILAKALQWTMENGQWKIKNKKIVNSQLSIVHSKPKVILMSASGTPYKQSKAQEFSKLDHLIIVCGHYEGVDQRFIEKYIDEEISIGDYVLTGGEIAAMVIADSVVRLISGVLEKEEATREESFSDLPLSTSHSSLLLEYPHYTRPEVFEGKKVPEILLSGDHQKIAKWRKQEALIKTKKIRPDLLTRNSS